MAMALTIIACILSASYIIVAVARKSRTDDLKIRRKRGKKSGSLKNKSINLKPNKMIQKEKIEQAAGVANYYKHFEESEAFKSGFYKGVRFAETEMKDYAQQRAQKFAEWIDKSVYYISGTTGLWVSVFGGDKHMQLTTAELYAKFEAEMNQQNNGG